MKVFKNMKKCVNLGVLMLILVLAEKAASSCSICGIYQPKLEDQ